MQDKTNNQESSLTRRDFIKTAAIGAGAAAIVSMSLTEGQSQTQPAEAPKTQPSATPLKLEDVLKKAREKLYPRCRVCPECDGRACSGEVPGMGGIGSGKSFHNNYDSLAKIQLKMKTFHDVKKPDTSITLWGHKLAVPILSAATGGVTYNMGLKGKMTDEEYIDALLGGCIKAGTIGMAADGIGDPLDIYEIRLKAVAKYNGKAIATIKPKTQEEIIKRIRMIEKAGGLAFAVDIDSAGRAARALPGQTVEPKTMKQLKELAQCTKLPFIIKGIMTVEEAEMAVECGAAGIVVSNHGGRVLDHTPGSADVLAPIADKVKGKIVIFVDGGIRYGADVLKMLALGADAVLVGRPLLRGAVGGGQDGVALLINKMKNELVDSMVLTGTADVKKVKRDILIV
ncbi:MAG: alpha-hydroxy-acid oxidizing protein [Thermodesulfovibrionales bacterium]|nr:alpha-hydroxy-acid oxidizing protein [Thermodesulfovibrionales bacterium]